MCFLFRQLDFNLVELCNIACVTLHYFSPECAQHRSPSRLFDFSSRSSSILVFHNLPFGDRCSLIVSERNLVLETVGRIEDSFDYGIDDLAAVHGNADFVADFKLLLWGRVGLFRHGKIVRHRAAK